MINFEKININKIADFIREGEKSCKNIGVECEHFILDKNDEAVSFYGEAGVEKILERLSLFYPQKTFSKNHLVGLNDDFLFITLEPAGQIEISIVPFDNLLKIKEIYQDFLNNISPILDEFSYKLVNSGYQPKSKVDDLALIPKERYEMMDSYFSSQGYNARYMMRGSASVQINIDYENEADFYSKFRLANILSPLFYLITDNSLVFENQDYDKYALRSFVWENVDNTRCGMLDFKSYFEYASWIYNTQPIFVNDVYCDTLKNSEIFKDKEISIDEIKHIISMVFPNVRVKQFIEIRPADSISKDYMFSYSALIKGIFYNKSALLELNDLFKNVTKTDIENQMKLIQDNGFKCDYLGYDMFSLLKKLYSLAENGLNTEEKELLLPLKQINLNLNSPKSIRKAEVAVL